MIHALAHIVNLDARTEHMQHRLDGMLQYGLETKGRRSLARPPPCAPQRPTQCSILPLLDQIDVVPDCARAVEAELGLAYDRAGHERRRGATLPAISLTVPLSVFAIA